MPELEIISRDLLEISQTIQAHARREDQRNKALAYQVSISAPCVHAILFTRRLRKDFLGIEIPERAWEMLLVVLAARLDRAELTEEDVGNSCGMGARTTTRWVGRLEKEGFLVRKEAKEGDGRVLIDLNDTAATRLCNYLDAALQISPWQL
ncbi:MAG TPA: hypothetical protein VK472_02640 [Allosphingosinicella sp.]|nr:hypothetical protein [Allosphingosinicella sp.]